VLKAQRIRVLVWFQRLKLQTYNMMKRFPTLLSISSCGATSWNGTLVGNFRQGGFVKMAYLKIRSVVYGKDCWIVLATSSDAF
jgi:hypothetical protein